MIIENMCNCDRGIKSKKERTSNVGGVMRKGDGECVRERVCLLGGSDETATMIILFV